MTHATSKTQVATQVTSTPITMEADMNNQILADLTNIISRMEARITASEQAQVRFETDLRTLAQAIRNIAQPVVAIAAPVANITPAKVVGTPEAPLYVATGINATKRAAKITAKVTPVKVAKVAAPKAEKVAVIITKDENGRPSNAKFHCECSVSAYGLSQGFADKHIAKGHKVITL